MVEPAQPTAPPGGVRCVVVTPERSVLDETAQFVALPMYDGELGVLTGRAPLIGRLGYGELRLKEGNRERRFFIDGGFAQVRQDVVTVLTSHAVEADKINVAAVEQTLQQALNTPVTTPEAAEENYRTQERARAQLRVARPTATGTGMAGQHA